MRKSRCFVFLVCLLLPIYSLSQHKIVGKVVNEFSEPLANISIRLSYIGSTVSDDHGEFFIHLPKAHEPGEQVNFIVKHDSLVIFEPSRGIWFVPKDPLARPLEIVLLSKKDHRFLDANRMKALMNDIIREESRKATARMGAQITNLQQKLSNVANDPLAEEAARLGFNKDELLTAIEKVKQELQQSADPYDVGLAALYDKHFSKAAEFIEKAIRNDEQTIREAERIKAQLPEKWLNLGHAQLGANEIDAAIAAYHKVVELEPTNDEAYIGLVEAYILLGGDLTKLQELLESVITFAQNEDTDQYSRIGILSTIVSGYMVHQQGQLDSAKVYYRNAMKISRNLRYLRGEAMALLNLGAASIEFPDSARFYAKNALRLSREIDFHNVEVRALYNLGLLYYNIPDSSLVYLYNALRLSRKYRLAIIEEALLISLGVIYTYQRPEPDSSIVYLKAVLNLRRQLYNIRPKFMNNTLSLNSLPKLSQLLFTAWITNQLLEIGNRFNDANQPDSAEVYYQLALDEGHNTILGGEIFVLNRLAFLYHEKYFDFSKAYEVSQQRIRLDSLNNSILAEFAENHFTTGRFAECEKRIAGLVARPELDIRIKIGLRVIRVANFLAIDMLEQVSIEMEILQADITNQSEDFLVGWSFAGAKHFITQQEEFRQYRDWLIQFFESFEKEGRDSILYAYRKQYESFISILSK